MPAWTNKLNLASDAVCPKVSRQALNCSMTQFTCEMTIKLPAPLQGVLQGWMFGGCLGEVPSASRSCGTRVGTLHVLDPEAEHSALWMCGQLDLPRRLNWSERGRAMPAVGSVVARGVSVCVSLCVGPAFPAWI